MTNESHIQHGLGGGCLLRRLYHLLVVKAYFLVYRETLVRENLLGIAEEPGTTVTLSYRSPSFSRAKEKNRTRIEAMAGTGRLNVLLKSNVKTIHTDRVDIDQEGKLYRLPNDAVIVCAGGVLPTPFLKQIGIEVETKFGTA